MAITAAVAIVVVVGVAKVAVFGVSPSVYLVVNRDHHGKIAPTCNLFGRLAGQIAFDCGSVRAGLGISHAKLAMRVVAEGIDPA
jgi:hypothetical protein